MYNLFIVLFSNDMINIATYFVYIWVPFYLYITTKKLYKVKHGDETCLKNAKYYWFKSLIIPNLPVRYSTQTRPSAEDQKG